jgi:glycopeptide antibiotics resistance protein
VAYVITYVKAFSTSFILALVAWPFLSAVLTLPILAGMYHRYHRLRTSAALAAYLCVFYALGLVTFTLYPMPDNPSEYCIAHAKTPQLDLLRFVSDLATGGTTAALQLLLNIAFFIPLGFALYRWARWKAYAVIPAGFLISLFIETSQLTGMWHLYPCAYRQFDVDDLVTNTLGAVIGCLVAWIYGLFVPPRRLADSNEINMRPTLLHRAVAFVIDVVFIGIATMTCAIGFAYWFHKTATPLPDGTFRLFGSVVSIRVTDQAARLFALLALIVFEVWVPVTHHGQTLGGMFTHMSCETKTRQGFARFAFYALRLVTLMLVLQVLGLSTGTGSNVFGLFGASSARVGWTAIVALAIFWLVARQMPYDLIPGGAVVGVDAAMVSSGVGDHGDPGRVGVPGGVDTATGALDDRAANPSPGVGPNAPLSGDSPTESHR